MPQALRWTDLVRFHNDRSDRSARHRSSLVGITSWEVNPLQTQAMREKFRREKMWNDFSVTMTVHSKRSVPKSRTLRMTLTVRAVTGVAGRTHKGHQLLPGTPL